MKFRDYIKEEKYKVPMLKKEKVKKLNPKTNRMKNFKKTMHFETDIPPEKRTFKNLPRYSDGTPKVKFQDWLLIKGEGSKKNPNDTYSNNFYGKSDADGKWYGWSHRAVYGFKVGDKIKKDTIGSGGKEFIIKDEKQAKEMAIKFAKEVA